MRTSSHRAHRRMSVSVLIIALAVLSGGASAAAAVPNQPCHLVLTNRHMPSVAVERGVMYHQDFWIDLNPMHVHCERGDSARDQRATGAKRATMAC